jgi:ADP-ribose pyrophosphatase YjhB (NUDIX family)
MAYHNISTSCILSYKDKILMVKEIQNGKVNWDIPAGGLDQGESILAGVCREVKEETGIVMHNPKLQRVFQFMQDETSSFNYLFMYDLSEKEVKQKQINEEDIKEMRFFNTDEVQCLINENNVEHELAKYRLLEFFKGKKDISDVFVQIL